MNRGDRVIIAHGAEGSPEINWFPWLKDQLIALGISVLAPQFPTPADHTLQSWMEVLNQTAGMLTDRDILVGHSTGALFFVNVLNSLDKQVKASVLVGGFVQPIGIQRYDTLNTTFLNDRFDWPRIRRNSGKVLIYYGNNDPYVPLKNSEELAKRFEVQPIIIKGGGHLNAEFGYNKFEKLLGDLRELY